jgi:hypothetical protein
VESYLVDVLDGAFDTIDKTVSEMRHKWNIPDGSDTYNIEHPILAYPTIAAHHGSSTGGSTLHPIIQRGIKLYKEHCTSKKQSYKELSEVPGRPAVLVRHGSYHDPSAIVKPCEQDHDWHRLNDVVMVGGCIYGIVNKTGRRKGWASEFWPEVVVRIAKRHVSSDIRADSVYCVSPRSQLDA